MMNAKHALPVLVTGLLVALLAACNATSATLSEPADAVLKLESLAFADGATIPAEYTCSGEDVSPELRWSGVPAQTQSFVLIMDDPDAPGATFTHWLLFNIPADVRQLDRATKPVGIRGSNNFGLDTYGGPCPPAGLGAHRYYFTLYALDVPSLKVIPAGARQEVENAMHGHILAQTQLMGRFER